MPRHTRRAIWVPVLTFSLQPSLMLIICAASLGIPEVKAMCLESKYTTAH